MSGPISLLFPETRSVAAVVDLARSTEARGIDGIFLGSAFGFDPIMALAAAGAATTTVQVGVAVVPTWPRHPVVMAQQAATASQMTGGRFRLGVGPSHGPVMAMYGLDDRRPLGHLSEYVTIVRALLREGRVKHRGERFQVNAFLDVADAPPPEVLLSALRPGLARVAGSVSDGVLPWLTPAAYLAEVVVPAVAEGAAAAERPAPPVLAELPAVLADDRAQVRAVAERDLAIYPMMPNYRAMWTEAGIEVPAQGWSDAMIDASIVWGDAAEVGRRIAELFAAGAGEVVLSPFGAGDDPAGSQQELIDVISTIRGNQ